MALGTRSVARRDKDQRVSTIQGTPSTAFFLNLARPRYRLQESGNSHVARCSMSEHEILNELYFVSEQSKVYLTYLFVATHLAYKFAKRQHSDTDTPALRW